jgi:uncharacterized protein (TIGR03083 family)
MSQLGVDGLRAERQAFLDIAHSLSDDEWMASSDCAGWSVRDVVGHMAASLHGVVDPSLMPDMSSGTEQAMEGPVEQRRARPIKEVLAEYEEFSGTAADAFAMLQEPPMADTMLPMADLGTHPMSILASTFLFDLYCHLRVDILRPFGPIDRPEPPRDEKRLRPTVEWMLAGLPWMCASGLAFMDRPIVLQLEGPGGVTSTLHPHGAQGQVDIVPGADSDASATVTSSDHDFVIWGTKRRPWDGFVKISGDDAYAARVLDSINII